MICARERKDTRMNKTAHIDLRRNKFAYVYVTKSLKNANRNEITVSSVNRRRIRKLTKTCLKL